MRLGAAGWPGPYVVLAQASWGATWECSARSRRKISIHLLLCTLIHTYHLLFIYFSFTSHLLISTYMYIYIISIYFSTFLFCRFFEANCFQVARRSPLWSAEMQVATTALLHSFVVHVSGCFCSPFLDDLRADNGSVCSLSKRAATTFLARSEILCEAKVTLTQPVEVDEVDAEIVVVEGGTALKLPCQNIYG